MLHCLIRILESLLRLLRRAGKSYPAPFPAEPLPAPDRHPGDVEAESERADPEWTERTLWLAMYGIDFGPRSVAGEEAAS